MKTLLAVSFSQQKAPRDENTPSLSFHLQNPRGKQQKKRVSTDSVETLFLYIWRSGRNSMRSVGNS